MKTVLPRLFVYPSDIRVITGKGERYSRSCYEKIKKHFSKEPHQLLTIEELAIYFGLTIEKLRSIIPP